MKISTWILYILSPLIIFFVFLFFPHTLFAQGTFNCRYFDAPEACQLDEFTCEDGYVADLSACTNLSGAANKDACNATQTTPFTCVPQDGGGEPPEIPANTYSCELDTANGLCILYPGSDNCSAGFFPGTECSTTPLGTCRTARYPCTTDNELGTEGNPCRPGNLCNSGLFCDLSGGFLCRRCGAPGQQCCPAPLLQCSFPGGVCGSSNTCTAGVCGTDRYFERRTFCSISALGRIIISGYTGCNAGEFCVAEYAPTSVRGFQEVVCVTPANEDGIDTAIGCVPISTVNAFVTFFWRWGVGISGGLFLLVTLWSGLRLMTAGSDEDARIGALQIFVSALSGIILLIFAVFLLRNIGINILNIL